MAGVRRLALEVGRGTNITIPGTNFPVSQHMPNCFFVPVTNSLLGPHVATIIARATVALGEQVQTVKLRSRKVLMSP
jgi:hypothetical protein